MWWCDCGFFCISIAMRNCYYVTDPIKPVLIINNSVKAEKVGQGTAMDNLLEIFQEPSFSL